MKKILYLTLTLCLFAGCRNFVNLEDYGKTAPTLGDVIVTDITATSATLSSSVVNYGSYSAKEVGFSYGTEPKPYETGYVIASETNYRDFSVTLKDLQPSTRYYVTPYIKVDEAKYFVGKSQEVSFTTKVQGDYSKATVNSNNYQVEINLRSCYRSGTRVTLEATILNKDINPSTDYYIYQNNYGYELGGYSYISRVQDEVLTDYNDYAVTKYLNSKNSSYGLSTTLPAGATKVLTVTIDGVPNTTKTISLYLASEFRNASPREYAYLTFENVPIY